MVDDLARAPGTDPGIADGSLRDPLPELPARTPGSVRRTMHVDVGARTDWGVALPISGAARDVRTGQGPHHHVAVLGEAHVEASFDAERRLVAIDTTPVVAWTSLLIGTRAGRGFRRQLASLVPADARGSLLHQVLDDMPAAMLISGYAFMRLARRAGHHPASLMPAGAVERMTDLCSGWRAGGIAVANVIAGHGVPVQDCPPAPGPVGEPPGARPAAAGRSDRGVGDEPADPWAFHELEVLAPDAMRRRRCIDVLVERARRPAPFSLWAWFRDTVGEDDGPEAVLHEYCVRAGGEGTRLAALTAEPRVLPFPECPGAASAVAALGGTDLADVSDAVPEVLSGVASCTHLNDLLRALGGADQLVGTLSRP